MTEQLSSTTQYLAEIFTPGGKAAQMTSQAQRLRLACSVLSDVGCHIRYVDSLYVPREETSFHLFDADAPEDVERALAEAGLTAERINAAVGLEPIVQRT